MNRIATAIALLGVTACARAAGPSVDPAPVITRASVGLRSERGPVLLAIVMAGARPVFADIDPVSICIDPNDIEHRITPRTKAIMVVHYAGRACEMAPILEIAARHRLRELPRPGSWHFTLALVRAANAVARGARGFARESSEGETREFLHRGIAKRAFERRFQLADTIRVTGAGYNDGLLDIQLVREVPEHKKPRNIQIDSSASQQTIDAVNDRQAA